MIAYNKTGLENATIQEAADEAYHKACITKGECATVKTKYPKLLYTPNIYIRIGLFILTTVIVGFSFGLIALILSDNLNSIGAVLIFAGLITYGALEFMIRNNKHYKSGVDDALMWAASGLLLGGLNIAIDNVSLTLQSILVGCIALFALLRYADRLMAAITYLAVLTFVFSIAGRMGVPGKAIMPFLLMAVSLLTYFISHRFYKDGYHQNYSHCARIIEITALLTFYLAGNYFVVREMSISMFNLRLNEGQSIPLGWLFWLFTFGIPVIYLYLGIHKKDRILLRTGLLLLAGTVFTIKYYYYIMAPEVLMTVVGILLIIITYILIRYLKVPKHGFTYEDTDDKDFVESLHIESILIAETYSSAPAPSNDFQFGGGSGGGGGTTGNY